MIISSKKELTVFVFLYCCLFFFSRKQQTVRYCKKNACVIWKNRCAAHTRAGEEYNNDNDIYACTPYSMYIAGIRVYTRMCLFKYLDRPSWTRGYNGGELLFAGLRNRSTVTTSYPRYWTFAKSIKRDRRVENRDGHTDTIIFRDDKPCARIVHPINVIIHTIHLLYVPYIYYNVTRLRVVHIELHSCADHNSA